MSLSRLNHWLPRMQAHPEVVQGTTEFHHQIADARLPPLVALLVRHVLLREFLPQIGINSSETLYIGGRSIAGAHAHNMPCSCAIYPPRSHTVPYMCRTTPLSSAALDACHRHSEKLGHS